MSRAPIAYSLGRPLEGEAGGAADLQTDIMRFMAILALCLMAIFALVQSLPDAPVTVDTTPAEAAPAEAPAEAADPVEPVVEPEAKRIALTRRDAAPRAPAPEAIRLTRRQEALAPARPESVAPVSDVKTPPTVPETEGFTLRFESDIALSRLVATGQVGFFALDDKGAQRMSVAANDISFWAAPMPARFHEMDAATVPRAVRRALTRTGRADQVKSWAVTLPARLTGDLERLMQNHRGGALVIAKDGSLRREAS